MSNGFVGHTPAIHRCVDTPLRLRLDSVSEIGGCSSLKSVHPIDGPLVGRKRIFGIENEDLPIVEWEFGRLPLEIAMAPSPIVGRLHRIDIEVRTVRRWQCCNALPKAMEAQKELDFIAPDHRANCLHRSHAAGADHRILAPDLLNQIAPERAQCPSAFWLRFTPGV